MTKEDLIKYGFKDSINPLYIMTKDLGTDLTLVITRERNKPEIALLTPDGTLFLKCNLEQLKVIEQAIMGYSNGY